MKLRTPFLMLAVGLALTSAGTASAALEQRGVPDSAVAAMTTYGMAVVPRTGLRTVVPSGWNLMIHRDVAFPETMSWTVGESWPAVLNRLAGSSTLAITIDWPKKEVWFRPAGVELDGTVRTASPTPLPHFDESRSASLVKAERARAEEELRAREEVQRRVEQVRASEVASREAAARLESADIALKAQAAETSALRDEADKAKAEREAAVARILQEQKLAITAKEQAEAARLEKEKALEVARRQVEALELERKDAERRAAEQTQAAEAAGRQAETLRLSAGNASVDRLKAAEAALSQATSEREASAAARAASQQALADAQRAAGSPVASAPLAQPAASDAPTLTYASAKSWNRVSVRSLAQGIAQKYDIPLRWAVRDATLAGPVTLLGKSLGEDLALLQKALGAGSDIAFAHEGGQLRAFSKNGTGSVTEVAAFTPAASVVARPAPVSGVRTKVEPIAPMAPTPPAPAALAPVASVKPVAVAALAEPSRAVAPVSVEPPPAAQKPATAGVDAKAPAAPAPAAASPSEVVLAIRANQPLEDALSRFARDNGFKLEWRLSGGFQANSASRHTGATVAEVLGAVLPAAGLSADIYTSDKLIVVRSAE